jgi:hypothetical protein
VIGVSAFSRLAILHFKLLPAIEVLTPSTIEHELEERPTVARLLFQSFDDLNNDQVFHVRVQLVEALAQLCKQQETPHQFKASKSLKRWSQPIDCFQTQNELSEEGDIVMSTDVAVTNVQQSLKAYTINATIDLQMILDSTRDLPNTTNLYCAFCKWGDKEASPRKRKHSFSRIDSLGRHVRTQHPNSRAAAEGFHFPYPECSAPRSG